MARSIAKGPKPRAGFATVNKNAPRPFVKKTWVAPPPQATSAQSKEPLGTVQEALLRAQKHGIAKVDARILLLHTLGKKTSDMAWLVANDNNPINSVQADAYGEACARRRSGEPAAYIVGHKEFYGLRLAVDKRVLDPRADTETLVDWALEVLPMSVRTEPAPVPPGVLDLGTGSGAIALAIQSKRPIAQVHATDASQGALEVAHANAATLKLPVQFHQGSWLEAVKGQQFDLIVSNPPYIAAADPHLAALAHEPLPALASGTDGLDDIRQIIAQAPAHLHAGGWLLLEHGYDQAATVRELLEKQGFDGILSKTDLAGIERCSGGQWPGLR
ncbi:MAG: peptide chain release factor N(5)-glutamine methyltransferase [Burkholderiaceae bacterium]